MAANIERTEHKSTGTKIANAVGIESAVVGGGALLLAVIAPPVAPLMSGVVLFEGAKIVGVEMYKQNHPEEKVVFDANRRNAHLN